MMEPRRTTAASLSLRSSFERDRKVWDSCARTYERQIVGGHPDVAAYEAFEEEWLDHVLRFLAQRHGNGIRLMDVGCGSARLHRRLGMRIAAGRDLPEPDRAHLETARGNDPSLQFDPLLASRLQILDGLDFSIEMLQIAEENLRGAGLGTLLGSRLRLAQGSAFELQPLPAAPLPVLVSVCNSIGVMQGPEGACALFRSMRNAVEQAGGIAIISAYRKEAVTAFALGNYESTLDVCGQPRWLTPDIYSGPDYRLIPLRYKRAWSTDPSVPVAVLARDGTPVAESFELRRDPDEVARTVESGHIRTYTDYESRWYAFPQFQEWIAQYWGGLNVYHLEGRRLDVLRGAPAQLAIADPQGLLQPLIDRWSS